MDMISIRDRILLATLPNVMFDGWTDYSLRNGVAAAGFEAHMAVRAFPGGIADLLDHFNAWADRGMEAALADHDLAVLAPNQRVALALRLRFEYLTPYREAVRRAVTFVALPTNAALAARLVYRTIDTLWFAVGDTATDFSFYSKRAMLAAAIVPATLYWLMDDSEGAANTMTFLERRAETIVGAGKTFGRLGQLGDALRYIPSPFRFARQLRRRVSDLS
ncbi:MAG: COQ9 family protein [Azospirillum sp.]|nr:COQ9 family protein [Azospirillum sp.]